MRAETALGLCDKLKGNGCYLSLSGPLCKAVMNSNSIQTGNTPLRNATITKYCRHQNNNDDDDKQQWQKSEVI